MRLCPRCKKWSLDYDSYFGRYRCFDSECEWMAPSSAEREIRLIENNKSPKILSKHNDDETGLEIIVAYDDLNDALLFDFGIKEPTYDLPESDGRVIWKIAYLSDMVAGIVLLGAKKFGVSQVSVSIQARKESIEEILRKTPNAFSAGRPSKTLIEQVELRVQSKEEPQETPGFFTEALNEFQANYVDGIEL